MPPAWLVERIGTYDWREALIRLSLLAATIANDDDGPRSPEARRFTSEGIKALTSSTPDTQRLLDRAQIFVRQYGEQVIAHEEGISYLQHLVLLYGAEQGDAPADAELTLWLLGVNDYLDAWEENDSRPLTSTESMIAELVKVLRFNRSDDALRALVRTKRLFEKPPSRGMFAGEKWFTLEKKAFGGPYQEYFDSFLMLLGILSHAWGNLENAHGMPMFRGDDWSRDLGAEGKSFVDKLTELSSTRSQLQKAIKKRMRPNGLLPHAPTALLHSPMVDLGNGALLATSPWNVRTILRSGVWARYLGAAKRIGGDKEGGDAWNQVFGLLFEEWMSRLARTAEAQPDFCGQIITPSAPGAADEIEDVVLREDEGTVFFSAKGRMVKEPVARHAKSRSGLMDWYESFFFKKRDPGPAKGSDWFRGGSVRQLSERIDMLRAGNFEPRLSRETIVYPVLVTYDMLCENHVLYEWLEERCRDEGLLAQVNVGPLTLADVSDFERLLAHAAGGQSVVRLLKLRESKWKNRRLEVQLADAGGPRRLPPTESDFETAKNTAIARIKAAAMPRTL